MKKKYFIAILLSSFLILPTTAKADDSSELPGDGDGDENTGTGKTNPNDRPKAPAQNPVSLELINEFLSINFRSPQGNAEIDVLNLETGITEHYVFDTSVPFTCYIGFSSIGYVVDIITDSGLSINTVL